MSQPHDSVGRGSPNRRVAMVADLYVDGRRIDCRILDLSLHEVRVEVANPPKPRSRVRLDFGRQGSVEAVVVWQQGACIGLRCFDDADAIVAFFSSEKQRFAEISDKRRFQRSGILWSGQIAAGVQVRHCMINDISAGGARVRLVEASMPDSRVTLKIDRLESYPCRVVWRKYDRLGLQFQVPHAEMARKLGTLLPLCRIIAA